MQRRRIRSGDLRRRRPEREQLPDLRAGARSFTVEATDQLGHATEASVDHVVAYNLCPLYDASKAKRIGSTFPINVQLCDFAGTNVSNPSITLTASAVTLVSTSAAGALEDAGYTNPDSNFRYAAGSGVTSTTSRTTGLPIGTYALSFTAAGDPTTHTVPFQVK